MTSFLGRVAGAYVDNMAGQLHDCCFIFPNKRSASFFTRELQLRLTPPAVLPATTSISELVASLSPLVEASRIDRLMVLHKAYLELTPGGVDFDRFIYWGEMLLSDFDDVDRYLVDASALFVNVKRFREIRSNYLTPEQLSIIRRYWDGVEDYADEVEGFWQHVYNNHDEDEEDEDDGDEAGEGEGTKRLSRHFTRLWMVMRELYESYSSRLAEMGLAGPGRLYRDAVHAVEAEGFTPSYGRYVFVGFNVLSASELKIFASLQARGVADFYWDIPAPSFRCPIGGDGTEQDYANKALRFVMRNLKMFPSMYDIDSMDAGNEENGHAEDATEKPVEVEIMGVPSRMGQVKVAGMQILDWVNEGVVNPANAIDTAVVLPDEALFIPAVNSMPQEVEAVNVTMGYPLKRTPVATFMRTVTSLHMRSRVSGSDTLYFTDDVLSVLSHSVASTIDEEACHRLTDKLMQERRFTTEASMIIREFPSLAPIFTPVADATDMNSVVTYTQGLLDALEMALGSVVNRLDRIIHRQFLAAYRLALSKLADAAAFHHVRMGQGTCFKLLERALASETIALKGEPLRGLQLMGVLETRALDFTNVIILSMNERIFPRKSVSRSFIPDVLRHAYRMSTVEHQESIFAYYFYRLISRARRVRLLYDNRTVGLRTAEMSRYLVQLLYVLRPGVKITHRSADFMGAKFGQFPVQVRKDERVMRLLELYRTPGSGKNLSASSLNCYLDCPLQFYLRFVEGYDVDDPAVEYIDSSTFGTIVHEVMQWLYETASSTGSYPVEVTRAHIERWLSPGDDTVEELVHRAIDAEYLKYDRQSPTRSMLRGETRITVNLVSRMVRRVLSEELTMAPFTMLGAEVPVQAQFELSPGLKVNVKQKIDRIDSVGGILRIVDYKTGSDPLTVTDMATAFHSTGARRAKAIVQLMFYCKVAAEHFPEYAGRPIQPMIYSMREIFRNGLKPLKVNKDEVTDFRRLLPSFDELLADTVKEIFDAEVPFRQTRKVGGDKCRFCRFRHICGTDE